MRLRLPPRTRHHLAHRRHGHPSASHEPLPATRAYMDHLATVAATAHPAAVAAALALTQGAYSALCVRLGAALALHFALPREALAFLNASAERTIVPRPAAAGRAAAAGAAASVPAAGAPAAAPAALAPSGPVSAFEEACTEVLAEGLHAGALGPSEAMAAARLLQGYELAYWHALYAASETLPEPLLRGTEGKFKLPDGGTLHYTDAGPRGGPVLLLLHGWPDSLRSWAVLSTHLHPSVRVLSVSLRGFGESTLPLPSGAADAEAAAVTKGGSERSSGGARGAGAAGASGDGEGAAAGAAEGKEARRLKAAGGSGLGGGLEGLLGLGRTKVCVRLRAPSHRCECSHAVRADAALPWEEGSGGICFVCCRMLPACACLCAAVPPPKRRPNGVRSCMLAERAAMHC